MEMTPNLKNFLIDYKKVLETKDPEKIDWEDFYYTCNMRLEDYEQGMLTSIILRKYNPLVHLDKIPTNFLVSGNVPESFEIPRTPLLQGIGAAAFASSDLKKIEIPHNIKKIGSRAFENCMDLESVYFSNGCTDLYIKVFSNCIKLREIHLPETLEKIGASCFYHCPQLRKLEIPRSVKKINTEAFKGLRDCEIIFDQSYDLELQPGIFDYLPVQYGVKVTCYFDTPIYNYCQQHDIPFGRIK